MRAQSLEIRPLPSWGISGYLQHDDGAVHMYPRRGRRRKEARAALYRPSRALCPCMNCSLEPVGGSADAASAASATPRGIIVLGNPVTIDGLHQLERYVWLSNCPQRRVHGGL